MESCHAVIHSLLGDHILTNTSHPETLHCLVSLLEWWIDLTYHAENVTGLDCQSSVCIFLMLLALTGFRLDLDCIPDITTLSGRHTWMTMACTAIFFNSMNSKTFKEEDGRQDRSLADVRCGPPMTRIEEATVAFGQAGAAWVFTQIARLGYEDREDRDVDEVREERLKALDGWPDDPWIDMLQLPWVPLRYRYPLRYALHFACGMVAEHCNFKQRKVPHAIKLPHLRERLVLDVVNFFGVKAGDLAKKMLLDFPKRQSEGLGREERASTTRSLIYEERCYNSEFYVNPVPDDWLPPTFTNEFNERLRSLRDWGVSLI